MIIFLRHFDGMQRLADRTDLIELDQYGIGDAGLEAHLKNRGIGVRDIVADPFNFAAQCFSQTASALPIILRQTIYE